MPVLQMKRARDKGVGTLMKKAGHDEKGRVRFGGKNPQLLEIKNIVIEIKNLVTEIKNSVDKLNT